MTGKLPALAKIKFSMIDVRDAAIAHVRAIDAEGAKNQRIIIAG